MKKEWLPALLLTLGCLAINGAYTAIVFGMAQLTPQQGLAERIKAPDGQWYYANIAQRFSSDKYFWPRPSAADYNAAGSGGSNKGPANPDYLKTVSARIDTFLAHNPEISRADLPAELVTASGSGLDPDISPAAALVQVRRIARIRGIDTTRLQRLIAQFTERFWGIAPERVNVLRLNLALDELNGPSLNTYSHTNSE